MGYNFRRYNQETLHLPPPSIADWVSEKSLARFIHDVVEHLGRQGRLNVFCGAYRSDGWGAAAEQTDRMEGEQFGSDVRGDELPEGLQTKQERLERITQAQKRLQGREQKACETQVRKIEQCARQEVQTGRKKRGRKPKDPKRWSTDRPRST